MEEKERYKMNDNDCLVDNEQNAIICDFCELTIFPEIVINLLNQQEKRIKELEEMNKKLDKRGSKNFDAYMRSSKKYTKLVDENLQLKEEIQQLKQSQKQLSISELEKVKKLAEDLFSGFCQSLEYHKLESRGHRYINYYDLLDGLNHQIKELEKDESYQQLFVNTCKAQRYLALSKARNYIEDVLDKALKNSSINEEYYDMILDYLDEQIRTLGGGENECENRVIKH